MPKLGKTFDDSITFGAPTELREKLVTLAYLRGDAGSYASVARQIMRRAVEDTIAQLDPQEEKDFKKILINVQTQTLVSRMKRQEREKKKAHLS